MAEKAVPAKKRLNIQQRMVSRELKAWRKRSDRTQESVAAQLGWSSPKLNRFENGVAAAGVAEVIGLAAVLGIPEDERDLLLALAEAGREGLGWWRAYEGEFASAFVDFVDTEAMATRVRNVQTLLIPGLLQIDAVTENLARAWQDTAESNEDAIQLLRTVRQRRQARLIDEVNPLSLHAIIHEAALREPLGGQDIKRRQLDHLLAMGQRPNVTIQVITIAKDAYPGFGAAYHLVDFEDWEAAAVYVENLGSGLYVEDEAEVSVYTLNFERLCQHHALDPEASATFLAEVRDELT